MDLKDRFEGAIMGCACGDAAGAPYEGMRASELRGLPHLFDPLPRIPGFPKGQYTDDTQLTLALAETYIERGEFDGDCFAEKIACLWREGKIVGPGASCTDAAYRIIAGVKWKDAGTEQGRAGNGSAMRASPAGLWNHEEPDRLKKDSRDQTVVTHKDVRAQAGAAAVAWAVAQNVKQPDIEPGTYAEKLADFIEDIHAEFAAYIRKLPKWLDRDERDALVEIACAGWIEPLKNIDFISPFVIPTVLVSLYYFLKAPSEFQAGLDSVIRAGGDVDTTGAIYGAISGARNGAKAIPDFMKRNLYQKEIILDTAQKLYSARMSG